MMMMAVVMGLGDLENKRGDQMNMAMVGLSTVKNYNCGIQYFPYWLLIFM